MRSLRPGHPSGRYPYLYVPIEIDWKNNRKSTSIKKGTCVQNYFSCCVIDLEVLSHGSA
jgi:hypothetical protein